MIRRMTFFFERSIRNKLMVALPLVIAFILAFLCTLSIFSLRKQVLDHALGASAVIQDLLLSQTFTLVAVTILTVVASIIVIAAIGHMVTDPLRRLAEEAEKIVEEGDGVVPVLSLADRRDEVGSLSKKMNALIAKLGQQQQQLAEQKLDAAVGKIATHVAHDIRSPLSSMQAALGQFKELKVKDSRYPEYLNLLELSAKRLTKIADDLLLQHGGTGKDEKTVFSLYKILDELIGEYAGQDRYQQVRFVKHYPSQAVELHGNSAQLQRAFGNIFKNAIEAMEGAGEITVRSEMKDEAVIVSITDTGPGMSPEKLEKVLNGGYTDGKQEGHGIGMNVVRETVAKYNGHLRAESVEEEGTTFFVRLPLPAPETVQAATREEAAIEKLTLQIHDKEPVVVIDDDPSMREQWRLLLQDLGRQVLLCESYENFVEQKITSRISRTAVVDYHFENSEKDGVFILDALKKCGFEQLYLCTAEYWKPVVQQLAGERGAVLCPKPLPKIEVTAVEVEGYTVLVIDDDPLIGITWKALRKNLNIRQLHFFVSLEKFIESQLDPSVFDVAFVDKNIEQSRYDGADTVTHLKSKGLARVVLASGENPDEVKKDARFAKADYFTKEKIPRDLTPYL